MARRILGLDLGSHSVKAVELRQTLRGVEVVQLAELRRVRDDTRHPRGPVRRDEYPVVHVTV